MSSFRISYRAFDALMQKFATAIERNALAKNYSPTMVSSYQVGYLNSFFAMELSNLDEDSQVQMFDAIAERIVNLNKHSSMIDLEKSDREINIA